MHTHTRIHTHLFFFLSFFVFVWMASGTNFHICRTYFNIANYIWHKALLHQCSINTKQTQHMKQWWKVHRSAAVVLALQHKHTVIHKSDSTSFWFCLLSHSMFFTIRDATYLENLWVLGKYSLTETESSLLLSNLRFDNVRWWSNNIHTGV